MKIQKSQKIKVQGWDLSLNHAAFIELTNGELSNFWYVTDNTTSYRSGKKHAARFVEPSKLPKEEFGMWRLAWWRGFIDSFLKETFPTVIGLEDYSFSSPMRSHQIGELGGLARLAIWNSRSLLRLHDPKSVKMFATYNGAAEKPEVEAAIKDRWDYDFSDFNPPRGKPTAKNPEGRENRQTSEDLCDAFAIAQLVWMEVQLRKGLVNLSDLHAKEIQVFNRTTNTYPVNILGREFIGRSDETAEKSGWESAEEITSILEKHQRADEDKEAEGQPEGLCGAIRGDDDGLQG